MFRALAACGSTAIRARSSSAGVHRHWSCTKTLWHTSKYLHKPQQTLLPSRLLLSALQARLPLVIARASSSAMGTEQQGITYLCASGSILFDTLKLM
jgi:hypothetical protein